MTQLYQKDTTPPAAKLLDDLAQHYKHPRSLTHHAALQLKEQFRQQGYFFFRANEVGIDGTSAAHQELVKLAKELPPDPHAKMGNRFRCLHHAIYTPWDGDLKFLPASIDPETGQSFVPYLQGTENQDSEAQNVIRRFAPMPSAMQKHRALRRLVATDFHLTPFAHLTDRPFAVTFHVIRHTVTPGHHAVSSPDLVHTDSVLLSFVHVIERAGVTGGKNLITKREHAGKKWTDVPITDVHALATVVEPFDGYAFVDGDVAHYVSAIEAAGDAEGARTILIIDFAPMIAVLQT